MEVSSYRDLHVWQTGMTLATQCYFLTGEFPKEEMYGMISQVRRAATSVPANIAEGYGRESTGDYIKFLRVAQGSLKELETHLLWAADVELTTHEKTKPVLAIADEIGRMLRSLVRSLQSKQT